MSPEEIKSLLVEQLKASEAQVAVDGSHVHIRVVSERFEGLSPVKKQQLVYSLLQDAIASGVIHAVHMQTFTPQQWAEEKA